MVDHYRTRNNSAITFAELIDDAERRGTLRQTGAASLDFFMKEAKKVGDTTATDILKNVPKTNLRTTSQFSIGKMYLYAYDPKHKATLPYFDRYPLIFPIDRKANGWLGLNMHYLSYRLRAVLMDRLYELERGTLTENKRLAIGYSILKDATRFKLFKPCIKHYLPKHVRSKLFLVPYDLWNMFLFLPIQTFEKQSAAMVWNASEKIIKRGDDPETGKDKK